MNGIGPLMKDIGSLTRGIGPKHQSYFYSVGHWNFSCVGLFYPIVPYAPAFFAQILLNFYRDDTNTSRCLL